MTGDPTTRAAVPTESTARPGVAAAEQCASELRAVEAGLSAIRGRMHEALAAAEQRHREVRDELVLVQASKARRAYLRLRAAPASAWRAIRHPHVTLGALAVRVRGTVAGWSAVAALRHAVLQAMPLRGRAVEREVSDQPSAADAVRWLGRVDVAGVSRHALFCHPTSSITYRATVPSRGTALVADCALVPGVWDKNRGGVSFHLRALVEATGETRERTVRLDPSRRPGDRAWRTLRLPLWRDAAEVLLCLETSLPPGAAPDFAWAVWGEPRLECRRDAREVWRLGVASLRTLGPRGAFRRLALSAAQDGDAAAYREWAAARSPGPAELRQMAADSLALAHQPTISVVTPVYDTDPAMLRACIESVRRQAYPHWELCLCDDGSQSPQTQRVLASYEGDSRIRVTRLPSNANISVASNTALASATGDFVALLDHDDELTPDALYWVARTIGEHPDADLIYSDEDKLDPTGGVCDPMFKPGWAPEHFLACMYTCHLTVIRRSLVAEVGGFRPGYEGSQDYDLVLRLTERTSRIHRIPRVLYHWRKLAASTSSSGAAKPYALDASRRALQDHLERTGRAGEVLPGPAHGLWRVKFAITGAPTVTIVIPTDGRRRTVDGRSVDLLANAVSSIAQKTSYRRYDLLVVDNGRLDPETLKALEAVPHRRVSYAITSPFNFAHKLNVAVSHAAGDHLVIFNDDLEVIAPEWLEAMLEYSQQERIGAVGARLLYPDGRLQHVGIVLGVNGIAAHAFHQHPRSSIGYASSAISVRNYSAVTGACMMTRRELFRAVGGFDEALRTDFNDVDYCLKLRRAGYRIVYTPYAELYHLEAGTLGPRTQSAAEAALMRERWADLLEDDPYYNPNLTRDFPDYRLRARVGGP